MIKFSSPPKEGEIWRTKSGNICLLIWFQDKLMMEWYDPVDGYTVSNLYDRLDRLATKEEREKFFELKNKWGVK